MAYDPKFELRIAEVLLAQGVEAETVKMFGGITFMVRGNMSVGILSKGDFFVKFDPKRHEEASEWPGAKPFFMGEKGGKGILQVDTDAVESRKALEKWVKLSLDLVLTLPPKVKKGVKKKSSK
ncbi:MAG: TfoX/Sxy family protein [Flavobacteriales bacterium]|jgi:TfoX/Sxy family transcriptional regulator of competence genes|nr:TfoX/Sxy family protein [Flavobacteriales bacterium]MBP9160965.1 TfoX/Sxy family protein [Flavobacteriales bacterium]MCI1752200.1 TfoX/Sxy family protein [Flavobacteriales bacterium]